MNENKLTDLIGAVFLVSAIYLLWVFFFNSGPGFVRDTSSWIPFSYKWTSGQPHPRFPHILSAGTKNHWRADPGYSFSGREGDLSVRWHPNTGHPASDKIRADFNEGLWLADPGYYFDSNKSNRSTVAGSVTWLPGLDHPSCPKIFAAMEPGYWRPVAGYHFVSSDNLAVMMNQEPSNVSAGSMIAKTAAIALAHYLSRPKDGDSMLVSSAKAVAGEVRNEAIRSVISDIKNATPKDPDVIYCDYWAGFPKSD